MFWIDTSFVLGWQINPSVRGGDTKTLRLLVIVNYYIIRRDFGFE